MSSARKGPSTTRSRWSPRTSSAIVFGCLRSTSGSRAVSTSNRRSTPLLHQLRQQPPAALVDPLSVIENDDETVPFRTAVKLVGQCFQLRDRSAAPARRNSLATRWSFSGSLVRANASTTCRHTQNGGAPRCAVARPQTTATPRALATSASSSTSLVLPIPGSPSTATACILPLVASSSTAVSVMNSARRPTRDRRVARPDTTTQSSPTAPLGPLTSPPTRSSTHASSPDAQPVTDTSNRGQGPQPANGTLHSQGQPSGSGGHPTLPPEGPAPEPTGPLLFEGCSPIRGWRQAGRRHSPLFFDVVAPWQACRRKRWRRAPVSADVASLISNGVLAVDPIPTPHAG